MENTNWRNQRRDPGTGRWTDHEVANAATTSKQEKLAKRQALMDRVIAETNLATTDNSLSAGGSGGYAPNGAIEMGPVAEKEYQSLLAQHKRETGMSKPGAQTNALKIRAINNTNPHLNERQRMILGDNLPTSKIGKKIIARDVAERPKNEAAAREAARAGYDPVPAQGYSELGPGPGPGESMAESIEDPLDRAVRLADMLRASILKQGGDQALADAAARELNRKLVAESTPGVVEELATDRTDRNSNYRAQVASTFQRMSDQALDFQDSVVVGGIDREELDKEITNRRFGYAGLTPDELAAKYIEQDINPTLSATEQNSILSQLDRITDGRGQSYIDVARNGSGAGQELDPYNPAVKEIMSFNMAASAFSDLGSAVQGQLEDYLEDPEREDLNPNAVRMIEDFLEEHSTDGLNNLLQASFDLEAWKESGDHF